MRILTRSSNKRCFGRRICYSVKYSVKQSGPMAIWESEL